MKKIAKFFIRILAMALLICLVIAFLPGITQLIRSWIPGLGGGVALNTNTITRQMREIGELASLECTEEGTFTASLPALIIGEAQRVTVPYAYRIDFGIDLDGISLRAAENKLYITLPSARILHDELTVTGKVDVFDFFYPLTEERYQQILNEQTVTLRKAYEDNPEYFSNAWHASCEKVRQLLLSLLDQDADSYEFVFEAAAS